MNIDLSTIDGRLQQAVRITARAQEVIANSQSKNWPYTNLPHTTRIFVAILAAQARDMAERATKQVGLEIKNVGADNRADTIAKFFADSAEHVGTDVESMADARLAALPALIETALELVARAERVLDGDETLSGQAIARGALWDK